MNNKIIFCQLIIILILIIILYRKKKIIKEDLKIEQTSQYNYKISWETESLGNGDPNYFNFHYSIWLGSTSTPPFKVGITKNKNISIEVDPLANKTIIISVYAQYGSVANVFVSNIVKKSFHINPFQDGFIISLENLGVNKFVGIDTNMINRFIFANVASSKANFEASPKASTPSKASPKASARWLVLENWDGTISLRHTITNMYLSLERPSSVPGERYVRFMDLDITGKTCIQSFNSIPSPFYQLNQGWNLMANFDGITYKLNVDMNSNPNNQVFGVRSDDHNSLPKYASFSISVIKESNYITKKVSIMNISTGSYLSRCGGCWEGVCDELTGQVPYCSSKSSNNSYSQWIVNIYNNGVSTLRVSDLKQYLSYKSTTCSILKGQQIPIFKDSPDANSYMNIEPNNDYFLIKNNYGRYLANYNLIAGGDINVIPHPIRFSTTLDDNCKWKIVFE